MKNVRHYEMKKHGEHRPAARNVERHANYVPDGHEFNIPPDLHNLAGDFVAKNHA